VATHRWGIVMAKLAKSVYAKFMVFSKGTMRSIRRRTLRGRVDALALRAAGALVTIQPVTIKRIFKLEVAVAAVALPLALTAPHGPSAPHGPAAPRLPAATVQESGNWAGYGDVGGSYHDVGAVWQVPAMPATKSRAYAYFWVGLGGDYGGSLLKRYLFGTGLAQIGIAEVSGSGAGYYPFWEVIPRTDKNATLPSSQPHIFMGSNGKPLSVKPGDFITASVSLTGNTYYMKMSDNRGTNNTIWSTPTVPASGSDLSNDSAEVIMEDPTGTPLADFGRVFFDGAFIDDNPIGSTNPVEFLLNPNPYKVGVSPIGANGDNFTINTPLPPVPKITSVGTYTKGVLVYFDIHYTDPGNDAYGFGFVGVNGSGWAEENHPFSSPSYGIVGANSIAYPFNEACGTAKRYSSYVEAWINDTAGRRSTPVVVHLVCAR
jgi:hypothetical protein